jgi:dipeptidyl aminopeptidase/acylaminoacyl peptidase
MICRRRRPLLALILTFAASLVPVVALAQRPMGIVDLLNVPQLADPQLSPQGGDVVYTLAEPDWKTGRRVRHVWRAKVDGGQPVQITNGTDGENTPRWSPDGKTVAFVAKRGDNDSAQIYLLPSNGGEARQLTSHASGVSEIAWAPDGSAVYFLAPEPKTAEEKARDKAKDDVYAFGENYQQTHVWRVAVATKVEARITTGDFSVFAYRVSRDGRKIAFHRAPDPLLGSRDQSEVWVMDADGTHALQLTRNSVEESGASVSPDDSQVLFLADANDRFETYYTSRLFVVPVSGGPARVLAGNNGPYDIVQAAWAEDGKAIYFLANMGVHAELFEMSASGGTPRQLTDGKHAVQQWSLVGDRHVFKVSEATNPGDVWIMAPSASTPTRVTHVFDYLGRDFRLARQEAIQWKGADGATVEGILSYPIDYRPGQRYPLAVLTHGGPRGSDKYGLGTWAYDIQVLAGKGYAVLQPNYRGSTGYGDPFLRDLVGHYFQNAHLDVMTGVDDVIRRGIADPDRLVKAGWSGGGHMTNKIITFTDRFKAAAAGAGAANWVSMYAQSDVRANRTPWFGGTPWQKNAPIDAYWNNSPLKDVANVKTPTIFFVGERDPRVPMPQSIEMYRALKSNGVPTRLYIAPREPHVWEELHHQLFKANAELEWFEKYAIKRPYTWEKAPDETKTKTATGQ